MKQLHFLFPTLLLALTAACTEPITIGSDILEDDLAEAGQTEDLPITTRVVRDDSLLVFSAEQNGAVLSPFSFGRTSDDVFGTWSHSAVFTPRLPESIINGERFATVPEFANDASVEVDSIVLILPIDTTLGLYGANPTFRVRMSLLSNTVNTSADIYSNYPRPALGREVTTDQIVVTEEPTLLYDTIYSATSGRRDTLPHIRIKFDQAFVEAVNALDTSAFVSTAAFQSIFPGVYVEVLDGTESLIPIRPIPLQSGARERSGFYFFYPDPTDGDDASFYQMILGNWLPRYTYDYTGSLAGELLERDTDSTQLLIGGTGSVMTAVDFPDVATLRNTLINRAELTYFRAETDSLNYDQFPSPLFVGAYYRNSQGGLSPILDRPAGAPLNSEVVRNFIGGSAEMEGNEIFFRNRFGVHLQGIVNAEFIEPTIYLRTVPVTYDPSRMLLRGPEASVRPMRTKVTFTRVR